MKNLISIFFSAAIFYLLSFNTVFAESTTVKYNLEKPFNKQTWLVSHNAYAFNESGDGAGFYLNPNQSMNITEQLNYGVRGFMLDIYSEKGYEMDGDKIKYCHSDMASGAGTCVFYQNGNNYLKEDLQRIVNFLEANPEEIVIIMFEDYSYFQESSEGVTYPLYDLLKEVAGTQLVDLQNFGGENISVPKAYEGIDWPTLKQFIDIEKRLIVFTDKHRVDYVKRPGLHYHWDYILENHWDLYDDYSCTPRGSSYAITNPGPFLMNHFRSSMDEHIMYERQAKDDNKYANIKERIKICNETRERDDNPNPTFIVLNYVQLPNEEPIKLINDLNNYVPPKSEFYNNSSTTLKNIIMYDVNKSPDCSNGSDRGTELGKMTSMISGGKQAITTHRNVCFELEGPRGKIWKGPYSLGKPECSLGVADNNAFTSTAACAEPYMILENNTETLLEVEIMDAADSTTCDKHAMDGRGKTRADFYVQPGESNSFIFDETLGKMCIILTGSNYRTSRTRPVIYDTNVIINIFDETNGDDTNDSSGNFYKFVDK